jgi:hypothetical protein
MDAPATPRLRPLASCRKTDPSLWVADGPRRASAPRRGPNDRQVSIVKTRVSAGVKIQRRMVLCAGSADVEGFAARAPSVLDFRHRLADHVIGLDFTAMNGPALRRRSSVRSPS